jgi:putative PIN family toxin of toxin-antitoxin system
MPLVILDVNVVASGIGPSPDYSPPHRIIDALRRGEIPLVVSDAFIDECTHVLDRARLSRWHGRSRSEIARFLVMLRAAATVLKPPLSAIKCPDPGDQYLWDLLAAEPETILVTGHRLLLESGDFPGRIVSPREFVDRYGLVG